MSATPASKRQQLENVSPSHRPASRRSDGDDSRISKAVLRRVAKHLENHFNFEIQENSFVTRSGSQRESIVLYNFPASRQYQQDRGGTVPQLVKPKVKRSVRKSISNPYVRCLVRTANEVVAKYPVRKLEKFHTLPLLQPLSEAGSPEADDAGGAAGVEGSKSSQPRCRPASQQSPRRLQNYRPHVANMLEAQHYVDFYSRQEMSHRPPRPRRTQPKATKEELQKREAMEAARKLIQEPKQTGSASRSEERVSSDHDSRSSHSSTWSRQQPSQPQQPSPPLASPTSPPPEKASERNSLKSTDSPQQSEVQKSQTEDTRRSDGQSASETEAEVRIRVVDRSAEDVAAGKDEPHAIGSDNEEVDKSAASSGASPEASPVTTPRSRRSSVRTGGDSSSRRSSSRGSSRGSSAKSRSLPVTPLTSVGASPEESPQRSAPSGQVGREQSPQLEGTADKPATQSSSADSSTPKTSESSGTKKKSSSLQKPETTQSTDGQQEASESKSEPQTGDPMSGAAQSMVITAEGPAELQQTGAAKEVANVSSEGGSPIKSRRSGSISTDSSSVVSSGSSSTLKSDDLDDSSSDTDAAGYVSSDSEVAGPRNGRGLTKKFEATD